MAKVARKSSSNEKAGIWLEARLTYLSEILCGSEKKILVWLLKGEKN